MNPFDLLKNSQAIKEQLEKTKDEIMSLTATGSSGGRMVTVTVNGKFEMVDIHLDPICVDNRDIKMLEDLIVVALNDGYKKADEMNKKINPTGGLI